MSAPMMPTATPAMGAAQAMRSMSSGALGPRLAHPQTGEEAQGVADVAPARTKRRGEPKPIRRTAQWWAHKNTRTAIAPIAVNPDSTMPHWRTRARAAATSPPRSERIWLSSGDMTKKA